MKNTIEAAVKDAVPVVTEQFGLECHGQLTAYAAPDWERFVATNGFKDGLGLFVPTAMKGYVNRDAPGAVSSALHELFGHGLFCEHSLLGGKVVAAAEVGRLEEHLHTPINRREQRLGIGAIHLVDYEGFATWLEATLCAEIGRADAWHEKRRVLAGDERLQWYLQLHEHFLLAEERLSRFGLMGQMGFPLHYDDERLAGLLHHIYSERLERIDYAIHYGSGKPTSDIDIVIVGDLPRDELYLGWLDISVHPRTEFERKAALLDIGVTDPLFSGRVIYGDAAHVDELRQRVLDVPITERNVLHSQQCAERMASLHSELERYPHERAIAANYEQTHRKNAVLLSQGVKALTKCNLEGLEWR